MNLRSTLVTSAAAVALLAGSSAQAAEDFYVSVFGGYSTFDDEIPFSTSQYNPGFQKSGTPFSGKIAGTPVGPYTVRFTRLAIHTTAYLFGTSKLAWEDDFDSGFVVGAALGRSFGENWRGEIEVAYRRADVAGGDKFVNDFDGRNGFSGTGTLYIYNYNYLAGTIKTVFASGVPFSGTFPPTTSGRAFPFDADLPYHTTVAGNLSSDGEAQVWSFMGNLWYDFNFMGLNPDGMVTFIGGGLGVASLDFEYSASMDTLLGGAMIAYGVDDSAMGLAYQLGAGVGFDVGEGMRLTAQYRWFGTSDIDVGQTDLRVESHNALLSLSVPLGNLIP